MPAHSSSIAVTATLWLLGAFSVATWALLVAKGVQFVFGCLPHGVSMDSIPALLDRGLRVVDLSADYRLRDPNVYAQWYGESHEDLAHLAQAVYGLPEIYGDEIPTAQLIANPGCYPQTGILGLAPLLAGKCVETKGIIIDSKSGVSGAGRTPKLSRNKGGGRDHWSRAYSLLLAGGGVARLACGKSCRPR